MADLVVNTEKLKYYADRIDSVNNRINKLDHRLDSLYSRVGLVGIFELLQADILMGYNRRLFRCKEYLLQTSNDFNKLELAIDYDKFLEQIKTHSTSNNVNSKDIAKFMEWLKSDWVDEDEVFGKLPRWAREGLKESLSKLADNIIGDGFSDSWDVTQELLEGDYLEALKKITEALYVDESKGFFKKLAPQFYINSAFGMLEEYENYAKDPSLINFLSIGWSGTVGATLETTGDAAWDVVKFIPGISDWYDKYGVEDAGDAFNTIYTESVRTIWGDSMADYCGSYYADNGGLFRGLINGWGEIKENVEESCKKHGGIFGVWLNGWNSMFS